MDPVSIRSLKIRALKHNVSIIKARQNFQWICQGEEYLVADFVTQNVVEVRHVTKVNYGSKIYDYHWIIDSSDMEEYYLEPTPALQISIDISIWDINFK